ncbi:MAG TPA: DUF6538 domain-containing protein, partial [Pseudolabrys sp.]
MSTQHHLTKRNGVFYYRRRVPLHLVECFGKSIIQFSLHTSSLKEAKKRRAVEELKWTTQFEAAEKAQSKASAGKNSQPTAKAAAPLTDSEVIRLVQDYVQRKDEQAQRYLVADPPTSERERQEMVADAEIGIQIIHD